MRRANDVADCVKKFLTLDGYEFPPHQQAHITMMFTHPEKPTLWVDCCGESITVGGGGAGTKNTKKKLPVQMMDDEQTLITAAKAVHRAECRWGQLQGKQEVGIAVPLNHSYWKQFAPLRPALEQLRIRVFFVLPNNSVAEMGLSAENLDAKNKAEETTNLTLV